MATVIAHVQRELDDPGGKAYTTAVVLPEVGQAYRDLMADLTSLDLSYDDVVATISNVPANTSDLSAYQASGLELENMIEPISVEWKLVGEDDEMYRPVKRVDKVIDAPASEQGILSWEWRKGVIYVSKSTVNVDVRVKFDGAPTIPDDASDTIQINLESAVGYLAAAKIAGRRGLVSGKGTSLAVELASQYERAKDNAEVQIVKGEQTVLRKWGRNTVRRRLGSRWLPPTV